MTEQIFKNNILNITAQKHQLYNMNFQFRRGMLIAEKPSVYPAPPRFPDLNLEQLLNWPDIKMSISFDYLVICREIKQNCERELVFGNDDMVGIEPTKNTTVTRYYDKVKTNKQNPMVTKEMLDIYLTSLLGAAPDYEVSTSKLPELEKSFPNVLDDIARTPGSSMQTKVTHSRFANEHKYFCMFDDGYKSSSTNCMRVRLREIINPEINFVIDRCTFTSDKMAQWQSPLYTEFEDMLIHRSPRMRNSLRDRFKKCLVLKCEKCNESFEGPLWVVKLKDHIIQKHFVAKDWTCVKCQRKWDQFELLRMGWKHDCEVN